MTLEFKALNKRDSDQGVADLDMLVASVEVNESAKQQQTHLPEYQDELSDLDQLLSKPVVELNGATSQQVPPVELTGADVAHDNEKVDAEIEDEHNQLSDLDQLLLFSAGARSEDCSVNVHTSDDVERLHAMQDVPYSESKSLIAEGEDEIKEGNLFASRDTEFDTDGQATYPVTDVKISPFTLLSSAASLLKRSYAERRPQAGKQISATPELTSRSLFAGTGNASLLANTLVGVSTWKCERIEKARDDITRAADALRSLPEFSEWQNDVSRAALDNNCTVDDVVSRLKTDEKFGSLKDKMDAIWSEHPDKVAAYRAAGDRFVKHIEAVKEAFPNTDEEKKARITDAMEAVEQDVQGIPGYGDKIGEYRINLAERIRNLVKVILEFMQQLAARLTGKKLSNPDLTLA